MTALARACHPLPTAAVTALATAFAWILGWHGPVLAGVAVCVLAGQLSVGWSNDAHDAERDRGRAGKPVAAGAIGARTLWVLAVAALAAAIVLSVVVAGWAGGAFHVVALAAAWAYNLGLARTVWSWLPYAIAFGCMPPFLTVGLDGAAPPWWLPPAFAITAVGAHLANALPDIDRDEDGLAVRLGPRRTTVLAWALLAIGTGIVALAGPAGLVLVGIYLAVAAAARRGRVSTFHALIAIVLADVAAIAVAASP